MDQVQATSLLSDLGLPVGPVERPYSNSNAVWMTSTHVVRSHIVGPPGRLVHEANAPGWLEEAYPELFGRSNLEQRLRLYELVALSVGLRHAVPGVRVYSEKRLADVLGGRSHVSMFGGST